MLQAIIYKDPLVLPVGQALGLLKELPRMSARLARLTVVSVQDQTFVPPVTLVMF